MICVKYTHNTYHAHSSIYCDICVLFIDKEIYKRSKAMKVNVKEVDIFKKMGNDDGDREGRLQQMTHQANLILQKANDEKRDYLVRALTKSVETNTKIRG